MTMISGNSYYAGGSRARSKRPRYLAAASALLLILLVLWLRQPLAGLFWSVSGMLLHGRASDLAGELAAARAALADREVLLAENAELKRRLGRSGESARVAAAVLVYPPYTPYDTLVIDAGTAEGVAEGDRVSAGGNALIGTVAQAYPHQSRVVLYSAPGEEHQALLYPSAPGTPMPLLLTGQGGGSLTAQVPAGSAVAAGDVAVLGGIAAGVSARAVAVDRAESESFATVYFQLAANPFGLRFVEILKQP